MELCPVAVVIDYLRVIGVLKLYLHGKMAVTPRLALSSVAKVLAACNCKI